MRTKALALCLAAVLAVSCSDQPTSPTTLTDGAPAPTLNVGPVVHHVSMGGNDVCAGLGLPNGCDANFSLTAKSFADGSVKGQWNDTFAGGGEGIHVAVDCLNVVGNGAVIGGVITNGQVGGVDVSGQRALTAVVDNGTSANDPPDQLSFSFFPTGTLSCTTLVPLNFPLVNLGSGQVKVK